MSNANTNIHVPPRFGTCVNDNSRTERCALSPGSCHPMEEFYLQAHVTTKTCEGSDIVLGRCGDRCAVSGDVCTDPNGHDKIPDGQCTLQLDKLVTGVPVPATRFPACKDVQDGEIRCVLDGSQCRSGEEELHPMPPNHCTCQDVKVGLCYQKGLTTTDITADNSFCAVNFLDCPLETHRYLDGMHVSVMDCRLCSYDGLEHDDKVGACVQRDYALSANQTASLDAVHHCAHDATQCDLATALFITREDLLRDFALYCPATLAPPTPPPVPKPTTSPTPKPAQATMGPTPKPTEAPVLQGPTTGPTPKPTPRVTRAPTPATSTNNNNNDVPFVPSSQDGQELSVAGIYWIVIGALAGAVAIGATIYTFCWYKRRTQAVQKAAEFMDVEESNEYAGDLQLPDIQ